MKLRKADIVTALIFISFSLGAYFYIIPTQIIFTVPEGAISRNVLKADFFPNFAVILFGLVSCILLMKGLRAPAHVVGLDSDFKRLATQVASVYIVFLLYALTLEWLGFLVNTPMFICALLMILGTRDWRYIVPLVVLVPPGVYYFFWFAFKVILPEGTIFLG
ncbi:MAG: tripartite tricarboxylate transporter TctB family protein [Nitrospinaceae bacterium]|jgi:hypothetical protein|nr:tripartite tricarboxylate transporter TctB family protein [Nitrospinaceae bacterium]